MSHPERILRKRKLSFTEEAEKLLTWSWLSIRLDWSIFENSDFTSRLIVKQMEQLRTNKDVDTISRMLLLISWSKNVKIKFIHSSYIS